jgi:uncharacterized protein (DUF111 family)
MKVKVISANGQERLSPEFEECKRIALEKNMSLREVYRIVESDLFSMRPL